MYEGRDRDQSTKQRKASNSDTRVLDGNDGTRVEVAGDGREVGQQQGQQVRGTAVLDPSEQHDGRFGGVSQRKQGSEVRVFRDDYSVVVERNLEYVRVAGGCKIDVA